MNNKTSIGFNLLIETKKIVIVKRRNISKIRTSGL